MKKRMMMLLTTVAIVMGLTACGDSTASTGNDAASNSTPSLVVEGTSEPTAEPTPEVTPEPTAEPAPQYTEVTLRDIQVIKKDINGTETWLPLIDGELPDTSLTMAEMYFHIPEGMSVTYEDILENAEALYGLNIEYIPDSAEWVDGAESSARSLAVDDSGKSGTDYATSADYTGDFTDWMSREEWESKFVLVRHLNKIEGEPEWWSNRAELKEEFIQSKKDDLVDIFNNYTYAEAYEVVWDYHLLDRTSEVSKKFWTLTDILSGGKLVKRQTKYEAAFEAYKADPTGWVDAQ